MKKLIFPTMLLCSLAIAARADVLFNESFNYADGPLHVVSTNLDSTTNWFRHSGTSNDSTEKNKTLQVGMARQDDVHRNFTTFTNTQTVVYGSFTVNCTNVPAVSNYFAHFYVNTTTFHGRVWNLPGSLPNTWRLGVTAAATALGSIKVFPVDLATNIDYQVVICWDPVTLFAATLWVNPINSGDVNLVTGDAVTSPAASVGFGFRQPSSGSGFFVVSNLVTAISFDEAATNVWKTNAVAPVVAYQPASGTNFVGDTVNVSSVASGQGLGAMTFQWQKNGGNIVNPNGNSNVLTFTASGPSDSGNYRMIATTPLGLSATSAVAFLWITNAPIPPTILPTTNTTVTAFYHQSATLTVSASGPPTISYQWYYTNAPASGANISDPTQPSLTISDVFTNNGTVGAYYCVASNPYGSKTSGVFTVTTIGPPAVSIAFLRTLVDGNYVATNSNLRWQATGVISTSTNVTSGDTSSYYLQDGTAGINIFTTHGTNIRFTQGNVVTFVGWLSSFNSSLELEGDANDPTTSFSVIGTNAALPAPKVVPFNITNNLAASEALEGSIVMLTNVYFGASAGTTISTSANQVVVVTNSAGETFNLFFAPQVLDTAGQTLPAFAYSVVGVLNQNLGNAIVPRNQGYQVTITRFSDIITDAPPAVLLNVPCAKCVCCPPPLTGSDQTLVSWLNVPWDNANYSYASNYSYTVLASANVAGPYVPVPYYKAAMLGINEVPAATSTASGVGTVVLSPDQTKITVNMSFSGLTGPATAAHIHGPAGAGTNASVLFPFTGVPNATSGTMPPQTFTITPTQLGYLQNGLLYMNVHTAANPGGEIRDQLRLTSSIGLTFANTSLTNTSPTTATFIDPTATSSQKYFRVTSP